MSLRTAADAAAVTALGDNGTIRSSQQRTRQLARMLITERRIDPSEVSLTLEALAVPGAIEDATE